MELTREALLKREHDSDFFPTGIIFRKYTSPWKIKSPIYRQ